VKEPKKTTRRKPASPAAGIAPAPAPKPRKRKAQAPATPPPSGDDRLQRIRETAYLLAEKDGFSGDPERYWAKAEQQVDAG